MLNSASYSDVYLISLAAVVIQIFRFKVLKMKKMSVLQNEDSLPLVPPTGKQTKKQTRKKLKRKNYEFSNGMLTETKIFEITNVSRYLDLHFVCLAVNEWLL